MNSRALVVSIHDVSPLTFEPVAAMLEELDRLGVKTCSLLVIPDHHHRGHFLDSPTFCEWLRTQARAGHEIVMHGYYHQRERKASEAPLAKLITRYYTADEGEFYDISAAEALRLVTRARDDFRKLGLDPSGFVAPAWLLSDPAETALRELNLLYTTRIGGVLDLQRSRTFHSQSMVYSVRNAWRRQASLVWNALLFHRLRSNPLLRVGIHPPDLAHPAIWRQIRKSISRALEDRTSMTYERWLSQVSDR